MQLHDLRRIAHKLALVVFERPHGLRVSTAGVEKHLREWDVDNVQQGFELLMRLRKEEK